MTLRFYARHDHRVLYPGLKTPAGMPPIYLGRDFVRAADGKPSSAPATITGVECEEGSEVARRIIRLMTVDAIDPPFFCDKATAAATGLPYVEAEFADGVWAERVPKLSTDSE